MENSSIFKPNGKDDEDNESAKQDPTFDEYHNMKEKEEDEDDKPKSTQLIDFLSAHVELELQQKYAGSQWLQVREAASSMELIILKTCCMFLLSESEEFTFISVVFEIFNYKFPLP